MKRIFYIILLLAIFTLSACKGEEEERTVVESEWIYDFIGIKSIEVNEELFITFCLKEKDNDSGMMNIFLGARGFITPNGKEYSALAGGPCQVYYDHTMYHGFDLLERALLTVEELELLEFPFSEVVD